MFSFAYVTVFLPLALSALTQQASKSDDDTGPVYRRKIFFQPPGYVFGLVWTILYLCLGLYLYMLLGEKIDKLPITILLYIAYVVNMLANLTWMPVVNRFRNPVLGIYLIGVMLLTSMLSFAIDPSPYRRALLAPYMTWLMLALALNVELAREMTVGVHRPSDQRP